MKQSMIGLSDLLVNKGANFFISDEVSLIILVIMQFGKKKQKLILNRVKKHELFPKMQVQYQSKIQTHFNTKDGNIIKIQNSSNPSNGKQNTIRCRSIQSLYYQRTLQKDNNQNRASMPGNTNLGRQVSVSSQETVSQLIRKLKWDNRSRGDEIANRNSILQFAQKIMEKTKTQPTKQHQKQKKLKICKAVSLREELNKQKKLSFCSNLQLCLQIERGNIQLELQNQQKELIALSNQHRYLKNQVCQQQAKIRSLASQIQQLSLTLALKTNQLKSIKDKINEEEDYLIRVQKRLKDITVFGDKQTQSDLQMQVQQYKNSQQELFNFAVQIDQTSSQESSTDTLTILLRTCNETFKRSLQSYGEYPPGQEQFDIPQEYWAILKKNITNTYQQTINKLRVFIDRRAFKLQRFVETMKSLASNTINKQEYLSLINQRMAIASVDIDRLFLKCDPYLSGISSSQQLVDSFSKLKELFVEVRKIYCEAEIFY